MSLFQKISKFVKGDADKPYNNWSQQLPSLTFTQLSPYGMAADPSVVAYEPLQQLLAVGTRKTTGIVRLFARDGQTVDLIPKDTRTATVQFLAFQPGRPVLVSVDSQNTITLFDLITRLPTFTHTARMTVTCIEILPSTDWLLVGYADASVDVYDIARGWRSPYVITDQHMRTTGISLPRGIPAVVGIVAHPFKLGKILIGYSTGLIILWDFTTRKQVLAIRPLSVPTPTSGTDTNRGSYEPQLTAIACHPDGSQVVAGYENGNLAFWDLENEKERPLLVRSVQSTEDTGISKDVTSPSVHTPVYKLTWCAYSSGQPNSTRLIIGGGADITTPQPAVHILDFSKSSSQSTRCIEFHPPILSHDETPTTVNNSSKVPCSASTVDFFVHAQSSPWRPICDPAEIIIVQEPCTLRRFRLPPWAPPSKASQIPSSWFNELQVPGDLQLVNSNITFSLLVTGVTGSTFSRLTRNLDEINSEKMEEQHLGPLKPEQITSSPSKNRPGVTADRDLFLTVHAPENTLRIWDAGPTGQGTGLSRCIAVHKLDPSIGESVVSPSLKVDGTPGVTAMKFVEMSVEEAYLAVGFSDGRVVVWNIGRRTSTNVQKNETIQVTALMPDETLEKKTPPAESTLAEPTSENDAKSNEITTEANDVSAVANENEDMKKSNEILAQSVKGLTLKTISSNASTTGAIVQRILVSGFRGCIRSLEVGGSGSLLAISDDHGMAAVVDVSSGVILMAEDINEQVDNSKSSASAGSLNCVARDTERNSVDTVTSMKFADAAVGESDNVKHRLLIGTQHGCVQMYTCMKSCDKPEEKGDGTETWTIVPDSSFRLHEPTSIIMMTVFDATGLEETPTGTSDKDGAPQITGDLTKTSNSSPSSPSMKKALPPLPDVTPAPVPAASPLEAPIKSSSKSSLPHLLLIVTSRAVRIHSRCTSTRLHKAGAPKRKKGEGASNVHFVGAAVVRQNGIPFLLCLTDESTGVLFSLPHLEIIQEIELNGVNSIGLREAQIVKDGRISVIAAPSEFKQLKLVSESEASQLRQRGFYDDSVTCPARPKEKGGGILGFFGIGSGGSGSAEPSSDDLDELLGGAARPKPRPPLTAASKPSGTTAAVAASTNAFSQAKQGLDERGERLGILADKMEGMEQSSADFLSSVREYNARQAKKKWYEL